MNGRDELIERQTDEQMDRWTHSGRQTAADRQRQTDSGRQTAA